MGTEGIQKVIGILGGMGPECTAHLFNYIVNITEATTDQDHIHIIIDNNPKIPDRTDYLKRNGESPFPLLLESAQRLERAGADFIIMPCHTAHFFYKDLVKHIDIPFLHLQEETLAFIKEERREMKRFGLLATTGTIDEELFQTLFKGNGEVVPPDREYQEIVMDALYGKKGAKSGEKEHPRELLMKVAEHLFEKNIDAVIAGCTEVSLVLDGQKLPKDLELIDPLKIIARMAIIKAGYQIKEGK